MNMNKFLGAVITASFLFVSNCELVCAFSPVSDSSPCHLSTDLKTTNKETGSCHGCGTGEPSSQKDIECSCSVLNNLPAHTGSNQVLLFKPHLLHLSLVPAQYQVNLSNLPLNNGVLHIDHGLPPKNLEIYFFSLSLRAPPFSPSL